MARLLFTTLCFCFSILSYSQSAVGGRIYEKLSDSLLPGINVFNKNTRASVRSDSEGRYRIAANEGDQIIFSGSGYLPDTMVVTYDKLLTQQDITLAVRFVSLKAIKVTNSYYTDSLNRRNEYRDIFDQDGVTGGNRPSDGVGVSISPLSFFSARARQQRALKKKLKKDEEESYIDYSFPVEMVERFTNLHGDSLRLFTYRYRPSYEFCRKTDRANMLVYISDKLKEFRKQEN